jgi:hypothetical protein
MNFRPQNEETKEFSLETPAQRCRAGGHVPGVAFGAAVRNSE